MDDDEGLAVGVLKILGRMVGFIAFGVLVCGAADLFFRHVFGS